VKSKWGSGCPRQKALIGASTINNLVSLFIFYFITARRVTPTRAILQAWWTIVRPRRDQKVNEIKVKWSHKNPPFSSHTNVHQSCTAFLFLSFFITIALHPFQYFSFTYHRVSSATPRGWFLYFTAWSDKVIMKDVKKVKVCRRFVKWRASQNFKAAIALTNKWAGGLIRTYFTSEVTQIKELSTGTKIGV